MHLSNENKILIGIVVLTIGVLVGGAYFLTATTPPEAKSEVPVTETLNKDLGHIRGNPNSKVKIVEYADYQCPACKQNKPIVDQVLKEYGDKIYFEYHHFPLPMHRWAREAAAAGEAAAEQNKFWEYTDVLYAKQDEWSEKDNAPDLFKQYAKDLGMDESKFVATMNNSSTKDKVQKSIDAGNKLGVDSTPTFFLNGKRYPGGMAPDDWKKIIGAGLK